MGQVVIGLKNYGKTAMSYLINLIGSRSIFYGLELPADHMKSLDVGNRDRDYAPFKFFSKLAKNLAGFRDQLTFLDHPELPDQIRIIEKALNLIEKGVSLETFLEKFRTWDTKWWDIIPNLAPETSQSFLRKAQFLGYVYRFMKENDKGQLQNQLQKLNDGRIEWMLDRIVANNLELVVLSKMNADQLKGKIGYEFKEI